MLVTILSFATVLTACGSAPSLMAGEYRARTATGQEVTVDLHQGSGTLSGTLGWQGSGPTGPTTLPVTARISGRALTLDLGLGLKITGTVESSRGFQLSYSQYPNGEPELLEPVQTLTFSRVQP